jgi:hypothetical protein
LGDKIACRIGFFFQSGIFMRISTQNRYGKAPKGATQTLSEVKQPIILSADVIFFAANASF